MKKSKREKKRYYHNSVSSKLTNSFGRQLTVFFKNLCVNDSITTENWYDGKRW